MSRKTLAILALPIILFQAIPLVTGGRDGSLIVLAVLIGISIRFYYEKRRWRRRISRLREGPRANAEKAIETMAPADRSAMRLAVGIRSPDPVRLDSSEGEVFSYSRPDTGVREYVYWASLICAAISFALLALGRIAPDQRLYFLLVGAGFAVSVVYQLRESDRQSRTIRVTPFGFQEIAPPDGRVGILWSEVAIIRNRRRPRCIEIVAKDGRRRIRVGFDLVGISRFMELLAEYSRANAPKIVARVVEETRTEDGWAMESFGSIDPVKGSSQGNGYVVAPDGSRAAIMWRVGEGANLEYQPQDSDLWAIYKISFPKPVFNAPDLAANFGRILPDLRARYEVRRAERASAAAARAETEAKAVLPAFRVIRVREKEVAGPATKSSGKDNLETRVVLEALEGQWNARSAQVVCSQGTWAISMWINPESQGSCVICSAAISHTENFEHLISSRGDRICARCHALYVAPENLGFIAEPAQATASSNEPPVNRGQLVDRISIGSVMSVLGRVVLVAVLLSFVWMVLSSWGTDTLKVRIFEVVFSALTLIVAFGLIVPKRLGLAFRFFAGSLGAGYLFMFYVEATHQMSTSGQHLTLGTPALGAAILLMLLGIPLLAYALSLGFKKKPRPVRGELYRSRGKIKLKGIAAFRTASSAQFDTVLSRREIITLAYSPPSDATAIYTVPRRYNSLEQFIVPPKYRDKKEYSAYALVCSLDQLAADFERANWYEAS